jgi:transcriptional regulator with XRE-family HTH domain
MATRELADFLRSRRDRIKPSSVGLPDGGRRRAPGLRRAEVALLAGISPDYYMRLEQGRGIRPSPSVLDALARALGLNDDERDHLYRLALSLPSPPPAVADAPVEDAPVHPNVRRLLDEIVPIPAYVINPRLDVLAWNGTAAALMPHLAEQPWSRRNMLRYALRDPRARAFYVEWEEVVRHGVAQLRTATGRDPDDPATAALVRELSEDPRFRTWWDRQDVQGPGMGRKEYRHPVVGRLSLDYIGMVLPGTPDHQFVTLTAPEEGPSARALKELAALARS